MGHINKKKLLGLKKELDKFVIHKDRVFDKIDDEMYLLSKSETNEKKKEEAQRNLAIFIIAELLESFETQEEVDKILEVLNKTFEA